MLKIYPSKVIGFSGFILLSFFLVFLPFSSLRPCRLLDGDLGAVMRAGEDFNWERINFVLEALWFKT